MLCEWDISRELEEFAIDLAHNYTNEDEIEDDLNKIALDDGVIPNMLSLMHAVRERAKQVLESCPEVVLEAIEA